MLPSLSIRSKLIGLLSVLLLLVLVTSTLALTDAVQMADFVWRGIAVWDKTECARPVRGRPRNQCEYVVWGSKGPMPMERNAGTLPGLHRESVKRRDKHHLTGKPVDAMLTDATTLRPFMRSASVFISPPSAESS